MSVARFPISRTHENPIPENIWPDLIGILQARVNVKDPTSHSLKRTFLALAAQILLPYRGISI